MKTTYSEIDQNRSLIERAQRGDQTAFESLFDLHRYALLKKAMRTLRNVDDANDAVQETAVKAFRAIHQFRTDRPFLPWLNRICSNCCIDVLRDRRHRCESLDDHCYRLEDEDQDIHVATEHQVMRHQILAALARLPIRYKEILTLRHFDHLEVIEIAERLKKPEGTIKSWLFRARALLRKELSWVAGEAA